MNARLPPGQLVRQQAAPVQYGAGNKRPADATKYVSELSYETAANRPEP
jgi:hypothetical protein